MSVLGIVSLNEERSLHTESVKNASCLLHCIASFEFIICLVTVSRLLEVTRPLTKQLQLREMDVVACMQKVTLLYAMLTRFRVEINDLNDKLYSEAVKMAEQVDTVPARPRTARFKKKQQTLHLIHHVNTICVLSQYHFLIMSPRKFSFDSPT